MSVPHHVLQAIAAMPEGRMLAVRVIEAGLRTGLSYKAVAAKVKLSEPTAKAWAAHLDIRKRDLAAETPEERCARHGRWALALAALGRMDEAAAWEAETRKLEETLKRICVRGAVAEEAGEETAPDIAFLDRVVAQGGAADRLEAWSVVFDYFSRLRTLGGVPCADGQIEWPDGVPLRAPPVPAWLPCDPWAVEDEAAWEQEVGAAMRML